MREYGILEGAEKMSLEKERWYKEMLKIEEEVKPYIPYVRQAFDAAMPVRKAVEFDPYRHIHDGIEFDPQTLLDQNKWMRGEIMKAYRNKIDRGEIIQINSFALDFSGSMDHERMRNLFKLLYLLVLGLEGRKTFDAFHFFSTTFVEAVNFSSKFTSRNLLFRILSNISNIEGGFTDGTVRYSGYGGTNMSEGIIQCHKRAIEFGIRLEEEFPNTDFLYSLFVLTDGRPTMGIIDPDQINQKIVQLRKQKNIAIKGIYVRPDAEDPSDFMEKIFGEKQFVETNSFESAISEFVNIMTATYKHQRKALKEEMKRKKYFNSKK
ncbi:MAG: vWA domain-containing protein, partial [Bacteroidota bacterium]